MKEQWHSEYGVLKDRLEAQGVDVEAVKDALKRQEVETPSWGYGNAGTRFQVFPQAGAPRNPFEKIEDAAMVHRLTGICPAVAIHIPWDLVSDYAELRRHAESLGLRIGAVNPNTFQDHDYKLGSICNPSPAVRRKAVEHLLQCLEIAEQVGSNALSLWFADGTNYAGQGHFRRRKAWMEECLSELYNRLPVGTRMLIEYKFFEPGFYSTDLADWGMAYNTACKLGDQAQVLVDLGHHPQGTNVEHIVAFLLSEGKLGGFHFNNRKYADDDLIVGSVNPFELFLVYNELVDGDRDPSVSADVAFMIDQSHNVEARIPAMIRSLVNVQAAYAKSLLVDREALLAAQTDGNVMRAHSLMLEAFETDVRPLLKQVRVEMGLQPDPLAAYEASGYAEKIAGGSRRQQRLGLELWGSQLMRIRMLTCEILSREVYLHAAQSPHVVDVTLLGRELHEEPDKLRVALQKAIDETEGKGYDAVALAYALCSNASAGLEARSIPVVLPRAHDCITLLLGSRERYNTGFRSNPGTYYYTPGWIERVGADKERISVDGREAREKIYQEYVEKYGEENAQYLMDVLHNWQKNYNRALFIRCPIEELRSLDEPVKAKVRGVASENGWTFEETEGDMRLVRKLVFGEWDADDFLVIAPGQRTQPSYDEQVITAQSGK